MTGIGQSDELFDELRGLNLDASDFAIFGSGPLIIRGIIPGTNDLDIVCRGNAWERVKRKGRLTHLEKYNVDVVTLSAGRLTFGTRWGIGDFDVDELIDSAEIIDGLPFVQLPFVIEYKRLAGRPKDREHLDALRRGRLRLVDSRHAVDRINATLDE